MGTKKWNVISEISARYTFFGLSTKSLETKGFTSVRTYVRMYVTRLLENRSLLFSETLQFVRACKREKNVPSNFFFIFPFCPFWPKTVQHWPFWPKCPKREVFRIFFSIPNYVLIFPNFVFQAIS